LDSLALSLSGKQKELSLGSRVLEHRAKFTMLGSWSLRWPS
jgi:hypothetical protein